MCNFVYIYSACILGKKNGNSRILIRQISSNFFNISSQFHIQLWVLRYYSKRNLVYSHNLIRDMRTASLNSNCASKTTIISHLYKRDHRMFSCQKVKSYINEMMQFVSIEIYQISFYACTSSNNVYIYFWRLQFLKLLHWWTHLNRWHSIKHYTF